MSTGYGWEGLRQVHVCATLLGVRHVPERLCGGLIYTVGQKTCKVVRQQNSGAVEDLILPYTAVYL